METDKFKILNKFLDDSSDLVESEFREDFIPLREAYKNELSQPGCTQCIRNACRSKYTQRIMGILNGEIDPKAPPPNAARPATKPQPQNPQQQSNASQKPPGYSNPELIPPNPGGEQEVVEPGEAKETKTHDPFEDQDQNSNEERRDITRVPFGKL